AFAGVNSGDIGQAAPDTGILAELFVADEDRVIRRRLLEPSIGLAPQREPVVELVRAVSSESGGAFVVEAKRPVVQPELVVHEPGHVCSGEPVLVLQVAEISMLPRERSGVRQRLAKRYQDERARKCVPNGAQPQNVV